MQIFKIYKWLDVSILLRQTEDMYIVHCMYTRLYVYIVDCVSLQLVLN